MRAGGVGADSRVDGARHLARARAHHAILGVDFVLCISSRHYRCLNEVSRPFCVYSSSEPLRFLDEYQVFTTPMMQL